MASAILKLVTVLGALFCVIHTYELTLNGEVFAWFDLNAIKSSARRNFLQLRFRTIHENGVLVYSQENINGSYYRLELIKASLRFTSWLGGNHVTNISLGSDLADGKWHSVKVKPTRRQTEVTLDSYPKTELAGEGYDIHSLNGLVFIGSMGKRQYHNRFRGCLSDVGFDGRQVLVEALNKSFLMVASGNLVNGCRYDDNNYKLVSFLSPNSYMKITVPKYQVHSFSTSFHFRSFIRDGVFISKTTTKLKFLLRLHLGSLLFELALPNGFKYVLKAGRSLHDGEWHSVKAGIYSTNMTLMVDNHTRTTRINYEQMNSRAFFSKLSYQLLAGRNVHLRYHSFIGCLMSLELNEFNISERDYDIAQRDGGVSKDICSLKNRCHPNPCRNNGMCEQRYKYFYCNCSSTDFKGKICEETIYRQNCAEYRHFGLKRDSNCRLRGKDSKRFYTALCTVTEGKYTYTVIRHMKMGNISVVQDVINYGYQIHEIEYPVGMEQIKALVKSSEHCRQFIRYDCFSSPLLDSPQGPSRAKWVSRDGRTQSYWGGADRGSNMCACGKTSNCSNPRKFCNCDVGDLVWRYDEGYFTETDLLPVTTLKFSTEGLQSYFTLGPLECWGTTQKVTSESDNKLVSKACNPVPLPTTRPTTKLSSTTLKVTSSTQCASVHCDSSKKSHSGMRTQTTKWSFTDPGVTPTMLLLSNKAANAHKTRKNGNPPSLEEFQLSVTAIILISCVLILILLLVIRCELPKLVVCVRGFSRRGEANFTTSPPRNRIPITAL